MDAIRESMKQLLDMILDFFEAQQKKVEEGVIPDEDTLLSPDAQEDNTDPQFNIRQVPENFKRQRD